jgi:WD40 repeat protein
MSRRLPHALVALLWVSLAAAAQVPDGAAPSKAPTHDSHGDPLPDGAVARLGTLRLVHLGGLESVAVSPDGKVVASGVRTGKVIDLGKYGHVEHATIRLWDGATGKLLREIVAPGAPVTALCFDAGGRVLYGDCSRFLVAWDVTTGEVLWRRAGLTNKGFSRDGQAKQLLIARDRLISIHRGEVYCSVEFDKGSTYLYHAQQAVRFWDSKTGKPLPLPPVLESTLRTEEARLRRLLHDVAVTADGKYAAVVVSQADPVLSRGWDRDRNGRNWRYTNAHLHIIDLDAATIRHTFPHDRVALGNLTFAHDGQLLAVTAGNDIWLIHTATGKRQRLAQRVPWLYQLAFVGTTNKLAAWLGDNTVRVWDATTGGRIEAHTVGRHMLTAAHNGRVGAAIHDNTVRLFAPDTGKPLHAFAGHRLTPVVRYALFSADTLLSRDGEMVHWWDTRSWKTKDAVALPDAISRYRWLGSHGAPEATDAGIAVEKFIYMHTQKEKRSELRDLRTDKLLRPLERGHGYSVFSAAGNRLLAHSEKGLHFLDARTGKQLSELAWPESRRVFDWRGLSSRGHYFAWFAPDTWDRVDIFQVSTGKLLTTLAPRSENRTGVGCYILKAHFAADEQFLLGELHEALGERRQGLQRKKVALVLWDVRSGKVLQEMVVRPEVFDMDRRFGLPAQLSALTLSHDHRLTAIAGIDDRTIELWEVASGTKRGELHGHDGPIASLAFSADDRQLASGSADTTILVWDLNRPLQPAQFKDRLAAAELAAHWQTLAQPDAKQADTAIWGLVHARQDSVPFLKTQLRPVTDPGAEHLQRLLDDLNSDQFKVRSKAEAELTRLGELALAALQEAIRQKNSLESQRRLTALLRHAEAAAQPFGTATRLREWRALEVLEKIGSPEARLLLRELAAGAPAARLTGAARAALARLESPRKAQN